MPPSTYYRRSGPYTASALQTTFSYDFQIFAAGDLTVWTEVGGVVSERTYGADYTVTGVGEAGGGTVVFNVGLAVNTRVTIEGYDQDFEQVGTLVEGGPYRASEVNTQLNSLKYLIKELARDRFRTLRFEGYEHLEDGAHGSVLPSPVEGAYLGWDADGIANVSPTGNLGTQIGSGTANVLPRFVDADTLADSIFSQNVGATEGLVSGAFRVTGATTLQGAVTASTTLVVTGLATFNGGILSSHTVPTISWNQTDAGHVDAVKWISLVGALTWQLRAYNDAGSLSQTVISATRNAASHTLSSIVINGDQGNTVVRIASPGNANMLYVDPTTNRIGIGTAAPSETLHVAGAIRSQSTTITDGTSGAVLLAALNPASAVLDEVVGFNGTVWARRTITDIDVDLTADVSGILSDANVADNLTINAGTITNTPISGSTGAFTTITASSTLAVTGLATFSGGILASSDTPTISWNETDAGHVDAVKWISLVGALTWYLRAYNDAGSSSQTVISATRNAASHTLSSIVINGDQGNTVVRIASPGSANMLYVDPVNNRVGVATGAPSATFDVAGSAAVSTGLRIGNATGFTFTRGGSASTTLEYSNTDDAGTVSWVAAKHFTGTNGPNAVFLKGRGTLASPSIVASGDTVGIISFDAHDGTDYERAAMITVTVDGTPGAGDMPGRIGLWTTPDGSGTAVERIRINQDGRVDFDTGVLQVHAATNQVTIDSTGTDRTASLENPFEVFDTNNTNATAMVQIRQLGTGDASIRFRVPATSWAIGIDNSDGDRFKIDVTSEVGAATRVWIDANTISFAGGIITPAADAPRVVTIASGTLAVTAADYHIQAAAETGVADQLDTITGGTLGQHLLVSADGGDTITIANGAGGASQLITGTGANLTAVGAITFETYHFVKRTAGWLRLL